MTLAVNTLSYPSGTPHAQMRQVVTWVCGLLFCILLSMVLFQALNLMYIALFGVLPNASFMAWISLAFGLWYYVIGFETNPAGTNSVLRLFGDYWPIVLPGGLIWVPKWIGKNGDSVNVMMNTISVTMGSTEKSGTENADEKPIYSKDSQVIAIEIELVTQVIDPYTWIVVYAEDPDKLITDLFDRVARWFAKSFDAQILVTLGPQMSKALLGELESITVNGTTHEFIHLTPEQITGQTEKTGLIIHELYVTKVNVSKELEATWNQIAVEKAEKISQLLDAQTGVSIAEKWREAGVSPDAAANMAALTQGREAKKNIVSVEGMQQATEALSGLVAAITPQAQVAERRSKKRKSRHTGKPPSSKK